MTKQQILRAIMGPIHEASAGCGDMHEAMGLAPAEADVVIAVSCSMERSRGSSVRFRVDGRLYELRVTMPREKSR